MACLNADSVKKVGHVHCLYQEINSNMADGQIAFSIVDGEPYVKVGADAPRPFNGDCVINIPGTVELYGYDNGAYKPLRAASIALKVQIRNRTATISSSASFQHLNIPGVGWERCLLATRP